MRYEFPANLTIDEVRSVIARHNERTGADAFIEADRGDHVIFNYIISFDGAFPAPTTGDAELDREFAILRECRGLTFCKHTGRVLNRKFAKFFNVNEKPETQIGEIDWSRPHIVLEKLDGSMITPLYMGDLEDISPEKLRWCTKMGITDVAAPVEEWVAQNPHYANWAAQTIYAGYTPIFEWCSRKQRIVVDYPEDRLVLTAIRNNATGEYLSYEKMLAAGRSQIEVVRALPGSIENIEQFMQDVRDMEGAEGYIIRFEDGHMLKVKGMWYVQIHKTKEFLNLEKDVVALIAHDKLDDVKPFMDANDRERVEAFHAAYEEGVAATAAMLTEEVNAFLAQAGGDKRTFANLVNEKLGKGLKTTLMFSLANGRDATEQVRQWIAKQAHPTAGTQSRVDEVRWLFGGISWYDYRDENSVSGDD